jgi:putative endonuclease
LSVGRDEKLSRLVFNDETRWLFCFMEVMFYVYIIYSKIYDTYYKGFTTDLDTRLHYHNTGKSPFTSRANDWVLVYKFAYQTKREALIEEKRLKKLNIASILRLIPNSQ